MKNLGKKRKINRRGGRERERETIPLSVTLPVEYVGPRTRLRIDTSSWWTRERGARGGGPEGGRRGNGRGGVEGGWCLWGAGVD